MGYKKAPTKPTIKIDWDKIDDLLMKGCNVKQCAARIGCDPQTLSKRCKLERGVEILDLLQEKHAKGDAYLHELQFAKAAKGSERMLIHLGEHRIGQKANKELSDSQELSLAKGQMAVLMEHIRRLQKESHSSDLNIEANNINNEQKS